jgi:hypothetical protein
METKTDFIVEENRRIRNVAARLEIVHAEGLDISDLMQRIGAKSPRKVSFLQEHITSYREWWQYYLEIQNQRETGQSTTESSTELIRRIQARDSSLARLEEELSKFLSPVDLADT